MRRRLRPERAGLGAHREAVAHYESALRYADRLPAGERARLLEAYAAVAAPVGSLAEAIDALGQARGIWQDLGDVDRTGRVLARQAPLLHHIGRSGDAVAVAREAIALLEPRPPGVALGYAYAGASYVQMNVRDIPAAIDSGTRATELAERFGDRKLLARALHHLGCAQWFTDPDRAESTLVRAAALFREAGNDLWVSQCLLNLGVGAGWIRHHGTSEHWLREAIDWCTQRDFDAFRDYCLAWLALCRFEQGRWSEAGTGASAAGGNTTGVLDISLTVLGRLRVRRGDPDPDGPLDEAWELAVRAGDLQRLWPIAAGRAEAAWLAGRPERVPGLVGDAYQLAVRSQLQWPVGELAFWLWRAGELEVAPECAAEPYAQQIGGYWRDAAASWEAIGCPYEVALALADSDDGDDLVTALEILGGLGAGPLADRVAARLRALGMRRLPRRPTRTTLDNPAGLTDRELEVLAYLAGDRTNADIAAALFISPKTAGHHVSAILAKLGVRNRREAARIARERGIARTEIGN